MRTGLPALLVFLVLAGSGVCSDAHAQAPGPAPAKRYPWDMRQPKCFLPDAIPSRQCMAEDWPSYLETKERVQRLLVNPDLDLILRAEKDLGFSQKRFPTGQYYFEAWYSALETILSDSNPRSYQLVEEWAKAEGKDGYVKIAEALLQYGEAWRARGPGFGNSVSREGWNIYERKLREANQVLDSAPDPVKGLGAWYALKLRIAYQLPDPDASRARLLAAGTDLWPDYVPLYGISMLHSLPRWGGTYKQVDEIAHMAYEKSRARWGASLYSLAYGLIFSTRCDCTIADTLVDWDLMKQGLRDIEKQGGGNAEVWHGYATFACDMRDRKEARRLLELSDKLRTNRSAAPPDPCREFAFSAT